MQTDLKRLLAYSTVENIGIIFIGLGLALGLQGHGMPAAAALALTAALFHVLNHSLFKSLLFFGAGAVLNSTGERDLERLGGLIHRMPSTAFAFLVGAVAISALPPFNGFVSEWLTFQAILLSPQMPSMGTEAHGARGRRHAGTGGGAGRRPASCAPSESRSSADRAGPAAAQAQEIDRGRSPPCLGWRRCVSSPAFCRDLSSTRWRLSYNRVGARMPVQAAIDWLSIVPIAESRSSYNGLLVFVFIAVRAASRRSPSIVWRPRRCAARPPGTAAFRMPAPSTQYSAGSFAQPIRRVFGTLVFRAREQVDMPRPATCGRPASRRRCTTASGTRSMPRSRRGVGYVGRRGSMCCSSSPSGAISASSSPLWWRCSWCCAIWP